MLSGWIQKLLSLTMASQSATILDHRKDLGGEPQCLLVVPSATACPASTVRTVRIWSLWIFGRFEPLVLTAAFLLQKAWNILPAALFSGRSMKRTRCTRPLDWATPGCQKIRGGHSSLSHPSADVVIVPSVRVTVVIVRGTQPWAHGQKCSASFLTFKLDTAVEPH